MKKLKIAWADLESAFENNAPDIHSYLNLLTGEVVAVAETTLGTPDFHERLEANAPLAPVRPFSSREQYRWLQGFIGSVEDVALRARLGSAIDGPGAFRRFKGLLLESPSERSRWFDYRNACAHQRIDEWLKSLGVEPVTPPPWVTGESTASVEDASNADSFADDSKVLDHGHDNGDDDKVPTARSPISSSVATPASSAAARPVELAQFISTWIERWAPAGLAGTNVAAVEELARAVANHLAGRPDVAGPFHFVAPSATHPVKPLI